MKVKFKGRRRREVVPTTGPSFVVEPDGEYEVDAKTGRALCEQRWFSEVRPPKKKTASKVDAATEKEA